MTTPESGTTADSGFIEWKLSSDHGRAPCKPNPICLTSTVHPRHATKTLEWRLSADSSILFLGNTGLQITTVLRQH